MSNKMFDFCIGNPAYGEETDSNSTRKKQIYNLFWDAAIDVSNVAELITPAKFLFRTGYTPKEWNEKMLNDTHFKVLLYEPNGAKIFPTTEIKGGVAIGYYNHSEKYGAIHTFTKYKELNDIIKTLLPIMNSSMEDIIYSPLSFQLSEKMKKDYPNSIGRLRSSAFANLKEIFYEEKPKNSDYEYIKMIGLYNKKRTYRYVRRDYIQDNSETLDKYSVLLAKANGSGKFGETLSNTVIAEPGIGYTQTFIGIGKFDNKIEALNVQKYIKSKFCRAMLGVLKITQDNPAPKWKYVPLQDFTDHSDIDWSKSIPEIDQQLYKKYGLSDEEIDFIETHVKEMK